MAKSNLSPTKYNKSSSPSCQTKKMINQELSKIFREISVLLEIKEVSFKPQAYEKVAYAVDSLEEDLGDVYKEGGLKALKAIPGVGESIADHIEEYIKTGRVKEYDKLKKEFPVDIESLRSVEGVGPKMILKLYKKLGIKNLEQLEKSAKAGKIRNIKRYRFFEKFRRAISARFQYADFPNYS